MEANSQVRKGNVLSIAERGIDAVGVDIIGSRDDLQEQLEVVDVASERARLRQGAIRPEPGNELPVHGTLPVVGSMPATPEK
ncbi:MAG: hypothetical protein U5O39_09170 [Gammaproteobacteria bacterium]|nr:hypothetical protein [Gammaproteobacteria bacterium]